jgi:hypothetical protein
MPRNPTTGVYTAPDNSWNPAVAGTVIDPDDWNATQDDYVAALNNSVLFSDPQALDTDQQRQALENISPVTTVIGDPETFWYPGYFGNPGDGVVAKINRLMIGAATLAGTGNPASPTIWTEAYYPAVLESSTAAVVTPLGQSAISGFSRTSDYALWLSGYSKGSQGVNGFAVNDDLRVAEVAIACGVFGEVVHVENVIGITEAAEFTVNSAEPPAELTPYGGIGQKTTMGVNVTVGRLADAGFAEDASAAISIGTSGTGVSRFLAGIILGHEAFDPSRGSGGLGVGIDAATGVSFRWLDSGDVTRAEIWGDDDGLHSSSPILLPDGSAAAPALAFANDPDTGIYRVSDNVIGIANSGAVSIRVFSNGATSVGGNDGTRRLNVVQNDAVNNAVTTVTRFAHTTSGTPATGIGAGVEFVVETATDNNEIGATIDAVSTDITGGSEDFDLVFNLMAAGAAAAEKFRISANGQIMAVSGGSVPVYTFGSDPDTGFYNPAANIIDVHVAGALAMRFNSSGNISVGGTDGARKFNVVTDDAANNSVTQIGRFVHRTTGTPGTGIGAGIEFAAETSASNYETGMTLEAITTDVTGGSEDFDAVIKLMVGGAAAAEKFRLRSTGAPIFYPPAAAETLGTNGQVAIEFTDNTTLTFRARGSDGTTRTATLTLA